MASAAQLGVNAPGARCVVTRLAGDIESAAAAVMSEFEAEPANGLGFVREGQGRLLRSILHLVIRPMVRQLRP